MKVERERLATVSGSFRRAMNQVQDAVYELTDLGVKVLSPADPRVVDAFGEFLFVASDQLRTIRLVQNRHLASIAASDLLWLVAPDGYVGVSAAMEIGYAVAAGTPVFGATPPSDLTLRQYVTVASPAEALAAVAAPAREPEPVILLDPKSAVERAHSHLERLRVAMTSTGRDGEVAEAAKLVRHALAGT